MKKLMINSKQVEYDLIQQEGDHIVIELNGKQYSFFRHGLTLSGEQSQSRVNLYQDKLLAQSFLQIGQSSYNVEKIGKKRVGQEEGHYLSPMPGKILKVMVKEGDKVLKGDILLVMEAMKMEHSIKALEDGVVKKICFQAGEQVSAKVDLVEVEA